MRNWTRRTISSLFLCRKLHLFLGNQHKLLPPCRAALLDSNMHRIICRLGLRPRPQGGAHSTPPDPLALFRGPTSKAKGEEGRGEKEKKGERKEGRAFFALERKKEKLAPVVYLCLSVCPSVTHRLSNKHFLSHLKYVATLLCNLSSMACFAGISVSQGSVATYARCGGSFNSYI